MSHSRNRRYYEYLAKMILECQLKNTYPNLVLSDCPDLVADNNCGIEVTQAMFQDAGKSAGLFRLMKNKMIGAIPQWAKESFSRLENNLIVIDGTVCGYVPEAQWFSLAEIQECFESKIGKLEGYQEFNSMDLFIIAPMFDYYELEDIWEFCHWCIEKQKGKKRQFDCVLVFDYTNIFVCDLNQAMVKEINCDNDLVHQCCLSAREFADAGKG